MQSSRNLVVGIFMGILITSVFLMPKAEAEDSEPESDHLPQMVHPVDLNRRFTFAGELLPSTQDVKERLSDSYKG